MSTKNFVFHRDQRRKVDGGWESLGVVDNLGGLTYTALLVLKKRYLRKSRNGQTIETPRMMLQRVAKAVAKAEWTDRLQKLWQEKFFDVMKTLEFWPGTRVLANAGKERQQLGNCFVFPIEDSIEDIFRVLYESSVTKKYGGGCGFNFSSLRPKGDLVGDEPSLAAGPVKIIELFDATTRIFRQQGRYESGNMVVLDADHPDILDFIAAKEEDGRLMSTNISVGATDKFMKAVKNDLIWELRNPRTGEISSKVRARLIFELIVKQASQTGDPGMLFLDTINKFNPLCQGLGPIRATNPCGEQPLYPYECCNLGYLNLPQFIRQKKGGSSFFDFSRLKEVVKVAVRMLDNTIDVAWFPVEKIKKMVLSNRRIGLGVVGWADVLARMQTAYDSPEALRLAEKVMKAISKAAWQASYELGAEKGPFPNVKFSKWKGKKRKPRNVALTTLPPSSSHGMIFNTSFGIEPFFSLVYKRNAFGGTTQLYKINSLFKERLEELGIYNEEMIDKVAQNHGSLQGLKGIPPKLRNIFKTAHDINFRDHIKMQSAFQKWVDNSVTKTINLPADSTVEDVGSAYMLAWELGCKGITVYRDKSRSSQVIEFGSG